MHFQEAIEIPNFRTKRPHKKSRLGCVTCKQRRIKVSSFAHLPLLTISENDLLMIGHQCDETWPCCQRCRHRGQECVYEERSDQVPSSSDAVLIKSNASNGSRHRRSLSATTSLSTAAIVSPAAGVSNGYLAQHYLTHTVTTFASTSNQAAQEDFWRICVPAVAYTSEPVQHGMLAIAALSLHFNTSSPTETDSKFHQAARFHGNIALKNCGEQLQDLQLSNTDSILTCSRIICVLGFAFFHIRRLNGATIADRGSWIWLEILRGVKTVRDAVVDTGKGFDSMIARDLYPEFAPRGADDTRSGCMTRGCSNHTVFSLVQISHRESIISLRSAIHKHRSDLGDSYTSDLLCAVDVLQEVIEQICSGEAHSLFRAISIWPCNVPRDFVDMLIDGNAFALAVYAHWLVLLILVEDFWWVGDMGRGGIRQIIEASNTKLSGQDRDDAAALLHWPRWILEAAEGVGDFEI